MLHVVQIKFIHKYYIEIVPVLRTNIPIWNCQTSNKNFNWSLFLIMGLFYLSPRTGKAVSWKIKQKEHFFGLLMPWQNFVCLMDKKCSTE